MFINNLYQSLTAKEDLQLTTKPPKFRRTNSFIPSKVRYHNIQIRQIQESEEEEEHLIPKHTVPKHFHARKYKDHVSIIVMHQHDMPEQVREERDSSGRGTGFPEPLSEDRNTTLPHPDADTSSNATIEAKDISPTRAHSRHRSFFGRHHSKSRTHHGTISVQPMQLGENIHDASRSTARDSSKERGRSQEKKHDSLIGSEASASDVTLINAKDLEESEKYSEKDTSSESDSDKDSTGEHAEKKRRRRVLRKLRLQKS